MYGGRPEWHLLIRQAAMRITGCNLWRQKTFMRAVMCAVCSTHRVLEHLVVLISVGDQHLAGPLLQGLLQGVERCRRGQQAARTTLEPHANAVELVPRLRR